MSKLIPNRPSEIGREAGEGIAKMADNAARVFGDTRCGTCAFRDGTIPNGCASTVMDAMKCVMEHRDFNCHEDLTKLCGGYDASRKACAGMPPVECPWPWSLSPEDEEKLQRKSR